MGLGMTEQDTNLKDHAPEKFSVRMSLFTWIICAVLGWAVALTSFSTLTGGNQETTLTAQNKPGAEEAAKLEQILPAAGGNKSH